MTVSAFAQPLEESNVLGEQLAAVIRNAAAHAPRSKQRSVGPSEIGEPCLRRLAYRLLEWPRTNEGDPWKPIVGTAVHAWLAAAFEAADPNQERWLAEQRVDITPTVHGTADLFDRVTCSVIDWKIVGPSALTNYRSNGPRPGYRVQAHLYGYGFERGGDVVRDVAIVFLPQSGYLGGMHVWREQYDATVATAALARLEALTIALIALDADGNPAAAFAAIPATPSHACTWCPFYRPGSTDLANGCGGKA